MMALLRSKPLRQRSEKAKARDLVLARTKREVLARTHGGRCEWCGDRDARLDLHHIWGRTDQPWCDTASACVVLCRSCHQTAQNAATAAAHAMNEELRWKSLERVSSRYGATLGLFWRENPRGAWLEITGRLDVKLQRGEVEP